MASLDQSFKQMETLLKAVWPAVSAIDWDDYCSKNHKPEPGEGPWYTGLMLYCSDSKGQQAISVVGEVSSFEDSKQMVVNKDEALRENPQADSSLELRDPSLEIWAGGRRDDSNRESVWCLTELPDLGDHLLLGPMMRKCSLLTAGNLWGDRDSETPQAKMARVFLGMSCRQYEALRSRMISIVASA